MVRSMIGMRVKLGKLQEKDALKIMGKATL
jgi:hypothetical protein